MVCHSSSAYYTPHTEVVKALLMGKRWGFSSCVGLHHDEYRPEVGHIRKLWGAERAQVEFKYLYLDPHDRCSHHRNLRLHLVAYR